MHRHCRVLACGIKGLHNGAVSRHVFARLTRCAVVVPILMPVAVLAKRNHINLRADYAWGDNSRVAYVSLGEAF